MERIKTKAYLSYETYLQKLLLRKNLQRKGTIGEISFRIRSSGNQNASTFVGKSLSNDLAGYIMKEELICRVCLKEGHKYIFDCDTGSIAAKINDIACLNITNKDNYPKYICDPCYSLLQKAVLFRKIAQESERRLQDAHEKKATAELSMLGSARYFGQSKDEPKVELKWDHEDDDVWAISDTEENTNTPIVTNKAKFKCKICSTELENNEKYSAHMLSLEHRKAIIGSVRSSNPQNKSSTPRKSVTKTSILRQNSKHTSTSLQNSKHTSTSLQNSKHTSTSLQKRKHTSTSPQKSKPTSKSPKNSKPASISPQKSEPMSTSPQKSEPSSTLPQKSEPTCTSSQKSEPTSKSPQKSEPTSTSPQKSEPTSTSPQKSELTSTLPQKSEPTSTLPQKSEPTSTSSQKSEPTSKSPEKSETTSTSPQKSKKTSASSKFFVCDVCGLTTNQQGNFKDHVITHTKQLPFPCPDCPYRARRLMALRAHRRIHTGERPYICEQCPRSFSAKSSLNHHVKTHSKNYKYKCPECKKGFHAQRELKEHTTRYHTGLKEHICDICKQEFVARKSLLIHYRNVHKVEKRDKKALYMLYQEEKPNEQ